MVLIAGVSSGQWITTDAHDNFAFVIVRDEVT
jgi:hypothetical protein